MAELFAGTAVPGRAADLFSDSIIPLELRPVLDPEPSTAGLLLIASTDPIGQIISEISKQPYSNIAFVCPEDEQGRRKVYWIDPWGAGAPEQVRESTVEDLAKHPLISRMDYRRLRCKAWAGKWGLQVGKHLGSYRRAEIRETLRFLFGLPSSGPAGNGLQVLENVFRDMGWQLGTPAAEQAPPSALASSDADGLMVILRKMVSPLRAGGSMLALLEEEVYFARPELIPLDPLPESTRTMHRRMAVEASRPLLQEIFNLTMDELCGNPDFLKRVAAGFNRTQTMRAAALQNVVGLSAEYSRLCSELLAEKRHGAESQPGRRAQHRERLRQLDEQLRQLQTSTGPAALARP